MKKRVGILFAILIIVAVMSIAVIKLYGPSAFPPNSPLVVIRDEGGVCDYGLCWWEITINRNGTWDERTGGGAELHGKISDELFKEMSDAVESFDVKDFKTEPSNNSCSNLHDTLRIVISIFSKRGSLTLDNCVSKIDYEVSPFDKIILVNDEIPRR